MQPYWGDGMGDALQWTGLVLIIAVSAAIVRVARRALEADRRSGLTQHAVVTRA